MTVAFCAPGTFVLLTVVLWIPILKWQTTAFKIGFSTSTSVLATLPLLDLMFTNDGSGRSSILAVSLALVTIVGITSALLSACVLGSSMNLPDQFPQAYATGLSLAALLVSMLRLLTKGIFSGMHDDDELRFGTYTLFFLCSFFCLVALMVYTFIVKSHSLFEKCNEELKEESTDKDELILLIPSSESIDGSFRSTLNRVKTPAVLVSLSMMVNVFINPGIIVDTKSKLLGDWFKLILLVAMSASDVMGRTFLVNYTAKSAQMLSLASMGRLMIMMTSVLVLQCYPKPAIIAILIVLSGVSHGYCILSCYKQAQALTKGSEECLTGGIIMLIAETVGSFIGSLLTIGATKI
eukprot:g7469.t1